MKATAMIAAVLASIVAAFAVAGTRAEDTTDAPLTESTAVRTDLEALTAACPGLRHATAGHWRTWPERNGEPSGFTIEALATLPAGDITALRDAHAWTPHDPPAATNPMRPHLPGGGWLHGRNVRLCDTTYAGAVYLHVDTGTVYLNVSTM